MTATTVERPRYGWVVLALALATAAIHVSRALVDPEISTLFWLNAIGYVVLAGLYVAPMPAVAAQRGKIRWALIAYTATTIALYFLWGAMSSDWPTIGFLAKAIEVSMIVLLVRDMRA
jgi:hypothetical protein